MDRKKIVAWVIGVCTALVVFGFTLPVLTRQAGTGAADNEAGSSVTESPVTESPAASGEENTGIWDTYSGFLDAQEQLYYDAFDLGTGPDTEADTETDAETDAEESSCSVHFIDVGQGNAVLIQADGEALLYDGGNYGTEEALLAYLGQQGITELTYLVISHYDADHCAADISVLADYPVGLILEPDYCHDTATYRNLMEAQEGSEVTYPSVGDTYSLGNGSFTVVCPVSYDYADSNNQSVGIRFTYGETSFLLTGDAELASELEFTEYCAACQIPLDSTVLLAGHHGSNSSTSTELLTAVNPDYVVISVGENEYGHPREGALNRIADSGADLYRTDLQGTIVFTTDGETLIISKEPCNDYTPGD